MINADLNKHKMNIEGEFETCFDEWMAVTSILYRTAAKKTNITEASELFSMALVEACRAGIEARED